jgi:hypothetical protein
LIFSQSCCNFPNSNEKSVSITGERIPENGYWKLVKLKQDIISSKYPGGIRNYYTTVYNDTPNFLGSIEIGYIQIKNGKLFQYCQYDDYTHESFIQSLYSVPKKIGESLLIASDVDSVKIIENDTIVVFKYKLPSSILSPDTLLNSYYYIPCLNQFPPNGWPTIRNDSIVYNSIQGKWSLIEISEGKYWSTDSAKYSLFIQNDTGYISSSEDTTTRLFNFSVSIKDLRINFSECVFYKLYTKEGLFNDTSLCHSSGKIFEFGDLSIGKDTLKVLSSGQINAFPAHTITCFSHDYLFVRK